LMAVLPPFKCTRPRSPTAKECSFDGVRFFLLSFSLWYQALFRSVLSLPVLALNNVRPYRLPFSNLLSPQETYVRAATGGGPSVFLGSLAQYGTSFWPGPCPSGYCLQSFFSSPCEVSSFIEAVNSEAIFPVVPPFIPSWHFNDNLFSCHPPSHIPSPPFFLLMICGHLFPFFLEIDPP